MKSLLLGLILALAGAMPAAAASGGYPWDKFPVDKVTDTAALQNGAKVFVNYCLNCHSASYMRYNRLQDIGLTEEQIKGNLLFATDRVGDTMKTTMEPKQAKAWFGAAPPDLSVIARSRAEVGKGSGADYLYTLWRTYYRDDAKPTGWNNLAFPDIGMPHALWQLQGERRARFVDEKDPHDETKTLRRFVGFEQITPGQLDQRRRRDGRRPRGLPAVDGRAVPVEPHSRRRRRAALPRHPRRHHVASLVCLLERDHLRPRP